MRRRARTSKLLSAAALAGAAYALRGRAWVLGWGATRAEREMQLPGDELLTGASGGSTRAITVDAPADCVWPWLVQMGPAPRAGAYTYDWIENLFGLDMHSADEVLARFQHPQPGEVISFGPNEMRMELIEAPHTLALLTVDGAWLWSFNLRESDRRTRLISRNRFRLSGPAARLGMFLLEPGSLIMERRMLLGLKRRAEELAQRRDANGD